LDVDALTKQNGVRLFEKLKKKLKKKEVKTNLPYLSFYKKKPETHIYFFLPNYWASMAAILASLFSLAE
jgi:ribonuclease HIII